MKTIVLTDDELKVLERRFGPRVRLMGDWVSDGTFGYSSVPLLAVQMAAEGLDNPDLFLTVSRLTNESAQTNAFVELLSRFGLAFINRIVDAYKRSSVEFIAGTADKPAAT